MTRWLSIFMSISVQVRAWVKVWAWVQVWECIRALLRRSLNFSSHQSWGHQWSIGIFHLAFKKKFINENSWFERVKGVVKAVSIYEPLLFQELPHKCHSLITFPKKSLYQWGILFSSQLTLRILLFNNSKRLACNIDLGILA